MSTPLPWAKALLLLFPLFFLQLAGAYNIDPKSCGTVTKDIEEGVKRAMELAQIAYDNIDKDDNENIKELRGWLFPAGRVPKAKRTYQNVLDFKELNKADTAAVLQPTIYCSLERFRKQAVVIGEEGSEDSKVEDRLYNSERGVYTEIGHGYTGCKDTKDTVAYSQWVRKDGKALFTDITICPWYLVALGHSEFKTLAGGTHDREGKEGYDPKGDFPNDGPTMDTYATRLDHVLLHEFTHALSKSKGSTDDPNYGWNKCVADPIKGCNNADTFSYFAVGVELIKNKLLKITKEGETVAVESSDDKKRSLGISWFA